MKSRGIYPWSPQLHNAGLSVRHWNTIIRCRETNKRAPQSTIKYLNTQWVQCKVMTMKEMKQQRYHARKILSVIQKNAKDMRTIHLTTLEQCLSSKCKVSYRRMIPNIRNREHMRDKFRIIRNKMNDKAYEPLDYLQVEQNGIVKVVNNHNLMVKNIIRHTKKIFKHEHNDNNLPTNRKLLEHYGIDAHKSTVKALLNGIFPNEIPTTIHQKNLMISCKKDIKFKQENIEITDEDFTKLFRHIKEKTASAPNGNHIGHYIAASYNPLLTAILTFHMNIPIIGQFVPKRWKQSIHILIPKDASNNQLNKLRTIQLLEPDFNALLKIKLNKVLTYSKTSQHDLGLDMYGIRPQMSTHDALMHQCLQLDITQQMHSKASLVNLDATKCFDNIFPNLANIALQILGIHEKITTLFAKTARTMCHRIKTAYGVSKTVLRAPKHTLWSGVGQGNAAAGPSWIAVEKIILKAWGKYHPMVRRMNPGKTIIIAYVDDNNIFSPHEMQSSTSQIQQKTIEKYETWSQLLEVTGGKLNDNKSHIYMWRWTVRNHKLKVHDIVEQGNENITIYSNIKSTHKTFKYLGITMAIDGNTREDYRK